jgi:outer membrane immunogenic protein
LRIFNSIVLATALAVPFASAASAAPFDGPYVGAQIGWQSQKMRNTDSSLGTIPVNDTKNSVTGGVFAGYDKTIGSRFVLGAEGGIDFNSDADVTANVAGSTYAVEPKYNFDLSARAGYLVTPQTLLYVRGGYSNERVRTTVATGSTIRTNSENHDGWLVGGGVERAINNNVSARLEYRYSKYDQNNGKDESHRVLAGLSYRF